MLKGSSDGGRKALFDLYRLESNGLIMATGILPSLVNKPHVCQAAMLLSSITAQFIKFDRPGNLI